MRVGLRVPAMDTARLAIAVTRVTTPARRRNSMARAAQVRVSARVVSA